ncbi:hypothetical protein [Burkholderia territorii]|uniref:hypothetical protein n=1 Tax=Burkholderia territorii TaxID=1503055 RepID=UPI000A755BD3|nr:hypothetical protein [Burkholderia territorii]
MTTMFEATLGVALMTMALANSNMQAVRANERNTAIQTGQYMGGLQAGINKFIATNGDQLSGRTGGGYVDPYGTPIALANPTSPTIAELQKYGFLPTGYTTNNPSNLAFKITITPTNCPGVGCQLPALIESSPYRDVQGNVRNDLLAFAVNAAGLDGGQSLPSNPGAYVSRGASWNLPNSSGAVGALAMRAGSLTTGYVDTLPFYKTDGSRALTGAMNANGNDIKNVATLATNSVTASGRIATSGYSPTDLPNGWSGGVRTWDVYAGGTIGVGPSGGAAPAAYLRNDGMIAGQNVQAAGSVTGSWLHSTGSAQIDSDQYVAGNQTVNGVLTARNVVNLPALAWSGWGCNGNAITTDPNGQILSCQAGVWTAAAGGLGVGQSWSSPPRAMNVTYQNNSPKPIAVSVTGYCGAGGPGSSNWVRMYVNGVMVGGWYASLSDAADGGSATGIVPPGGTYYVTYNNSLCGLYAWSELS